MIVKMEQGFKNEENARQLVQNEMAVMKEEIQNLKIGSGSIVCSEASTRVGLGAFARPSPLSSRWTETWIPRKMNFSKSGSKISHRHTQGITDNQIKNVLDDLEKMMPLEVRKWTLGEQTRNEQCTWP